jgi:hypothetical protein
MVAAGRRVGEIDRARCRQWVLERFTVERMADGYERPHTLVQKRSSAPSLQSWSLPNTASRR